MVTATSGRTTCETLRQHCHNIVGMVLSACSASKLYSAEDGMEYDVAIVTGQAAAPAPRESPAGNGMPFWPHCQVAGQSAHATEYSTAAAFPSELGHSCFIPARCGKFMFWYILLFLFSLHFTTFTSPGLLDSRESFE